MVSEIWSVMERIICHFGPKHPKNQIFEKMKKHLEISSFYINVPKIIIICYIVLEIQCVIDVILIFYVGLIFALLPPNDPKNQSFKKMKKNAWRHHHFTHV